MFKVAVLVYCSCCFACVTDGDVLRVLHSILTPAGSFVLGLPTLIAAVEFQPGPAIN